MEPKNYVVRKGDTLSGIAKRFGHRDWKKIWNFKPNEKVKKARKAPNLIEPGDNLKIPPADADIKAAEEACRNEVNLAVALSTSHALIFKTQKEAIAICSTEAKAATSLLATVKSVQSRLGKGTLDMLVADLGVLSSQVQALAGGAMGALGPVTRSANLAVTQAIRLGTDVRKDRKNKAFAKGFEAAAQSWTATAGIEDGLKGLGLVWEEIADVSANAAMKKAQKLAADGNEAARGVAIQTCVILVSLVGAKRARSRRELEAAISKAGQTLKQLKAEESASVKRARAMPAN